MLISALLALAALAPTDEKAEVQAAVDAFIAAINSNDAAELDRLTHDDGAAFIKGYVKDERACAAGPPGNPWSG